MTFLTAVHRAYTLVCSACKTAYPDSGEQLLCTSLNCMTFSPQPLLVSCYNASFYPTSQTGLYRYANWLPIGHTLSPFEMPPTLQLPKLNQALGLPNLWVTLSGFAPEYHAFLETGSFKEVESQVVLSRRSPDNRKPLVIASAKNSASAYIKFCSLSQTPCIVVVPDYALPDISKIRKDDCVKVIAISNGDYAHAIQLAQAIGKGGGFQVEGGIYNVGRRDGVGAIFLSAVDAIGKIPDWYVQAVGSGTGPIAVLETVNRLKPESLLTPPIRFLLSQSTTYSPMVDAWDSQSPIVAKEDTLRTPSSPLFAQVLSTRQPYYSGPQGIHSLLSKTKGSLVAITDSKAKETQTWFRTTFNIDLDPAASIALASLQSQKEQLPSEDTILLHLTGLQTISKKLQPSCWEPDLYCSIEDLHSELLLKKIEAFHHD